MDKNQNFKATIVALTVLPILTLLVFTDAFATWRANTREDSSVRKARITACVEARNVESCLVHLDK